MAENPMFNNSNMFTNVNDATHKDIEAKNASEVLATQGNVINSIKTFWNKLRTKLAYAISRPNTNDAVGGNYQPVYVNNNGDVVPCSPSVFQTVVNNGTINLPEAFPIYAGQTVCFNVTNSSGDNSGDLKIGNISVYYPTGATVKGSDVIGGSYLFTYISGNGDKWILNNKINAVDGNNAGLMTVAEHNKLANIAENANNYSLPAATSSSLGGIQLGYTTNENDKNYRLQTDTNGNGYVNVPWTVYSLPTASGDTLGGVKSSSNTDPDNNNKIYHVGVNTNGIMTVNVPWTDTTYTLLTANSSTLGGVKLGADKLPSLEAPQPTSSADRYYPIQTDKDDKLVVNVPWTDNHNTAYLRAGNNNSISNEATNNGNTYLKIVDGGSKSSLKISGTGGTEVKSDADGNITISSPKVTSYTRLDTSSKSPSVGYLIKGPGTSNANTKYYLAGNGNWVNGILVPVPPTNGNFTLKCNNGVLSWG